MLNQWLYIGIFFVIAMALPAVAIIIARILSPKKPNKLKNSIYECGMETYKQTWIQYKVQYYLYGLIFLIFDVEVVFLFPIAVAFNKLALFAVVEAFIFILILLGGYLYIWKKDALTWQF